MPMIFEQYYKFARPNLNQFEFAVTLPCSCYVANFAYRGGDSAFCCLTSKNIRMFEYVPDG